MQTPIETAFADLCAKHDVYAIAIEINLKQSERARWLCTIHHGGPTKFNGCVMEHGSTPEDAMRNTFQALAEDRAEAAVEVPALTIAEAA